MNQWGLRMRIAYIGHKRIPGIGGIDICVQELVENIKDTIHYNRKGNLVRHLFVSSFKASINADIVHYHGVESAIFCWIPKLFGKKVILTIHSLPQLSNKWGWKVKLFIKLSEWLGVKVADEVIVVALLNTVMSARWSAPNRRLDVPGRMSKCGPKMRITATGCLSSRA